MWYFSALKGKQLTTVIKPETWSEKCFVKMAAHEYFRTIDSNFQIKLPVKEVFPIHSGVDFSALHITAIKTLQWEFMKHICQHHTNLKIPAHYATDVLALRLKMVNVHF